ncbi:MAG: flagellar hook-length control protein FliK [Deltaproteobacteria bacterium]|nr:flagellar hook-length control protein FliK [Deltaproteobacteria bacterium]
MTLATQTVNMDAELLKPVTFIQAIENKNTKKPDKADQGSFAELLNERSTAINENKAEKEKSPLPGTARKADTSYQGCKEAKESNKKEVHLDPSAIEKNSPQNEVITLAAAMEPSTRQGMMTIDPASLDVEDNLPKKLSAGRMDRSRSANVMPASISQTQGQIDGLKNVTLKEPALLSGSDHPAIDSEGAGKQEYSKGVSGEGGQNILTISPAVGANSDVKSISPNNENDNPPGLIIKNGAFPQEQILAGHSEKKMPENGDALFVNGDSKTGIKGDDLLERRQNSKEVFVERVADILRKNGNEDGTATKTTSQIKNIVVSSHDEAPPAFTPNESAFSSADTINKKVTAAGSELNTARTATSADKEMQQILPTSKGRISEKMTGPTVMEPLNMLSSFSEKMMIKADNVTGLNAQSIIDQIADARQDMGKDLNRVKITLNPPNLGTVDLEVTVRQNRVEVVMIVDHSGVQQVLQSHAEDIKSAFQRQDMKIDSFQVLLQNNSDGNQQQSNQGTAMHEQSRGRHLQHFSEEDSPDMIFTSEDHAIEQSRGLVSIFA